MKAVGYRRPLPISDPESLLDIDLAEPVPGPRDLLVDVRAIAVNPVDYKIRASTAPSPGQPFKVLGWDASGVVRAVGTDVTLFAPGDRVWYAGSIARPGANSQLHLVDERVTGHAPASLDFAQAAALPLTGLTAWEMLFDRLRIPTGKDAATGALLIIGAAGGVGSIMTQLAAQLTGLTVIGTASRPETQAWVRGLGAHHVIDHGKPLAGELARIGIDSVETVVGLTRSDLHFDAIVDILAPQGRFGLIDDPGALDVMKLKRKSLSLHWELMFTRSLFGTPDMIGQHRILEALARLVDTGEVRTTVAEHYGRIDAANLRRAHALLESGKARGKIVLEGW